MSCLHRFRETEFALLHRNLTRCQEECTQLLLEKRELAIKYRDALDTLIVLREKLREKLDKLEEDQHKKFEDEHLNKLNLKD